MLLSDDIFKTIIQSTPLVSFDLIITDDQGKILLGERLNRPAKGTWFVPGGRVRKNERLDDAFIRLGKEELGHVFIREHASLLGVFEHFYDDNMYGENASTHYVVLAYAISWLSADSEHFLPLLQHSRFRWWSFDVAIASDAVHANTKAYIPFLR